MAYCEEGKGEFGEARTVLEQVVEDHPDLIPAHLALASAYELALLGASAGAEVHSFEPTEDFLTKASSDPGLENIFWPLLRML